MADTLRFLLVVDAATGLVQSVAEIDEKGTIVQDLQGKWVSVAPRDGSATTLVFAARKDAQGKFPAGPVIKAG